MSQSTFKSKVEKYVKPRLQVRVVPGGTDNFSQYRRVPIKDAGNEEVWNGQPFLADIFQGTDKKTKDPYYSAGFDVIDHDTQEILRANIYLNGMEDDIELKEGSAGYELVKSIDAVNGYPTTKNTIEIKFSELQNYIYNLNALLKAT